MAKTPVELFRAGNKTSPRMGHVRPVDVHIFMQQGKEYVKGHSGGISTFESPSPSLGGTWWSLPKSSDYDESILFLQKVAEEEGEDDHWRWEPEHDMLRSQFEAALASLNGKFRIVP